MKTYKTCESVRIGHPDKLCDFIADFILDSCLEVDPDSRVACEVMATGGKIMVAGEITCELRPYIESDVKKALQICGYSPDDFRVFVNCHRQSKDICFLLSAAALLAGVRIYSELKGQQREKEDFKTVAEIAELPMTEAPAESVTDTETEPSAEPTEQPVAEHNIQALIAENTDCIGWLSIDSTNISYPVMHTPKEPQKYLRRSFYGKYSQSGVPFLDGRCNLQSTNLIIYGHNMKNGTMFADLKKYLNTDFLNAHRTVRLETADGVFLFAVTEVLKTNTADLWYDRISCEDGRRLILSTCYGSGKNGRLLIIGRGITAERKNYAQKKTKNSHAGASRGDLHQGFL